MQKSLDEEIHELTLALKGRMSAMERSGKETRLAYLMQMAREQQVKDMNK